MVAEKDNHKIYFEFKVGKDVGKRREAILRVKKQADEDGADFHLVYVSPPSKVAIEIDNIEERFRNYLADQVPKEVQVLSDHVNIDDVNDVEIGSINIEPDCIRLKGIFVLGVRLQHGSNGDVRQGDGMESEEAFVTTFEAEFDDKLNVISLDAKVDTSSWYE